MLNTVPFRGSKGSGGRQALHPIQVVIMSRILLISILVCLTTFGCAAPIELYNAAPRLTWVHVGPATNGIAEITLWVFDVEGDPTDLELSWSGDNGVRSSLTMAAGGHGTVGLTTRGDTLGDDGMFDPDGQPHLLRWDFAADGVTASDSVRLHVVPTDHDTGPSVTSPSFTLEQGMANVTRFEDDAP